MNKYHYLIELKLQEQLLTVAKYLKELKANYKIQQIPFIIKKIIDVAPKVLPTETKLFQILQKTVIDIKTKMLSEFHSLFEAHLTKSEELISDSDSKLLSWSQFLSSAREWLISYTMISILPSYLQDANHKLCIDSYNECLDSAFTPLWGRFYFHLCNSRNLNTIDQILWTFDYSKSFLSLLLELCDSITTTTTISSITPLNQDNIELLTKSNYNLNSMLSVQLLEYFRMETIKQFIEKICRFLRSHVADCITMIYTTSTVSTSSTTPNSSNIDSQLTSQVQIETHSETILMLLDYSLDLDSYFSDILENFQNKSLISRTISKSLKLTNNITIPKLTYYLPVNDVFFDHELCQAIWIQYDEDYFRNDLLSIVKMDLNDNSEEVLFQSFYESIFQTSISTTSHSNLLPQTCFQCIYNCLFLFQLSLQRYKNLTNNKQNIFILIVIFPVLESILNILHYYKINFFHFNLYSSLKFLKFNETLQFIQQTFRDLNDLIVKYHYHFNFSIIKGMNNLIFNYIYENRNNKSFNMKNIINKIFDENRKNKVNELKNNRVLYIENKTNLIQLITYYSEKINDMKTEITEIKVKLEKK